ncbi:unnamed protein product [Alopecurus aequalis]
MHHLLLPCLMLLLGIAVVLWLWPGKVLRAVTVLVRKVQRPVLVVRDRVAAHHLLVRGSAGGFFSDRPASTVASAVLSRRKFDNMNSAPYGPLWRTMRRNLTSDVFHPQHLHRYASARRRALSRLLEDLRQQCRNGGVVLAAESIRTAMFGLLVEMTFGQGVDEGLIRAMSKAMSDLVKFFPELRIISKLPIFIAKIYYRERWTKLVTLRRNQEQMYLPLIKARRERRAHNNHSGEPTAYVDTLIDLQVEGDGRSLADGELVGMCSEFLGAGTDAVATELQWIMAELVKNPDMQEAIRREMDDVVGAEAEEVGQDVLGKLEYLNAVVMEGLRLHPAVHTIFREVTKRDHVLLEGRRLRTGTVVVFPLASPALDKTAWADPKEFKPQRFMGSGGGENTSLLAGAGSAGEIRMMPFGAGRRMCPGMGVAMLHMAYFMANILREFEWKDPEGELAVDLKPHGRNEGFFTVMKRPLRANLVLRRQDKHKT